MAAELSVIIPVYNAEAYLAQCLDSILVQGIAGLEILCIDDHSTDSSPDILRQYADAHPCISVFRNAQNARAGVCRNMALERAKGAYVFFMDADDFLIPGSLAKLLHTAKTLDADVIRCRAYDYDNQTGAVSSSVHNALKRIPFFLFDRPLSYRLAYPFFAKVTVVPWGGLFRRAFLLENCINFNDLLCVNDRSFFWACILQAKTIVFSRVYLLYYRQNMGGSLIGGRIRHFDCHFRSYAIIEPMTRSLPNAMRRSILNAEMLDMANWYERCLGTPYAEAITKSMRTFLSSMDKTAWHDHINHTRWWRRIGPHQRKHSV